MAINLENDIRAQYVAMQYSRIEMEIKLPPDYIISSTFNWMRWQNKLTTSTNTKFIIRNFNIAQM